MPRKNTENQLDLNPETAEKVRQILQVWRQRFPGSKSKTFCNMLGISYQRFYQVLYKGVEASPYLLSQCQRVLEIDLGYPKPLEKVYGRVPHQLKM